MHSSRQQDRRSTATLQTFRIYPPDGTGTVTRAGDANTGHR